VAAQITFRGSTFLDAGEGVYDFEPIEFGYTTVAPRELARSVGSQAINLGVKATFHKLGLWLPTATASMAALHTRFKGFADGVAGTLVIPDFGSYNHCVLMGPPERNPQKKITRQVASTAGYDLYFGFVFMQTRA
jgi:hypothetical protein